MRSRTVRRGTILLLFITVVTTSDVHAQASEDPNGRWTPPTWVGDVTFVGLNSLISGITAGLMQELRDGSFQDGFAKGALGGAIAYGGRRLAAADFDGAGFLGRQFGAVGASMARNAGDARPLLSRLQFPVGPVTFDVLTGGGTRVKPRVNLMAAGWIIAALLDDRMELDGGASLSAGIPVFRAPNHIITTEDRGASGIAAPGMILIAHDLNPDNDTFTHERIHIVQMDFAQILWGDPIEDWMVTRIFGDRAVLSYFQPGIAMPLLYAGAVRGLDYQDRPWEIEASFVGQR